MEKMHDAPFVSVIIPAYNATEYLPFAIESLLAQTMEDWEAIIVDDCSPDGGKTLAMAQEYAARDGRIRVISTPSNRGCGPARNFGLGHARGTYVFFLDADDMLDAETFSIMSQAARNHDADIVRTAYDVILPDGRITGTCENRTPTLYDDPEDLRRIALCIFSPDPDPRRPDFDFGGTAWGAFYRHSILDSHGIRFPEKDHFLSEDYPFSYAFTNLCRRYVRIPATLYHYRQVENSITHTTRLDMLGRVAASSRHFKEIVMAGPHSGEEAANHARGYYVNSIRAYVKQVMLNPGLTMARKRQWLRDALREPLLEECVRLYPWRRMRFRHRLYFSAFARGRFMLLYLLIRLKH